MRPSMPPLMFRAKYDVFEDHHARLRDDPDPDAAARRFSRRLRQAKVVNRIRVGLYVLAYFSLTTTALVFLIQFVGGSGVLQHAVRLAGSVSSTLAIVAIAGVVVCSRYLGLADVELYFFSAESRLARR